MYKDFYGFSKDPFNFSPDPRFIFLTQHHREVLNSMIYGITERRGFILLSGETGTGKTTLVRHLIQVLDPKIKAIPVYQPPKSFDELLEVLLRNLNLPLGERSKRIMWSRFIDYISQDGGHYENYAIIVDDAQDLSKGILEELRELWNPNPERLQEVFVGRPEIEDKLNSWDLRQLKQRIVIRCRLRPLTESESLGYIEHRLNMVGSKISEIFAPEALSSIYQYSQGNPRAINILCDKALSTGITLSQKPIDSSMVEEFHEAPQSLFPKEPATGPIVAKPKPRLPAHRVKRISLRRKIAYALGPLLCLVLIIFWGRTYLRAPVQSIPEKFPPQQAEIYEKGGSPGLGGVSEFSAKVNPVPEQERKPVNPTPATEPGAPQLASAPAKKSSDRIQAQIREKTSPASSTAVKTGGTDSKPSQTAKVAQISPVLPGAQVRIRKVVAVQEGDSLYTLLEKYCQVANTTLVDYVLQLNPRITNPDRLLVNQKIKLPAIMEESLIFKSSEGAFKIHLGTFLEPQYADFLREEAVLKGKDIEIISRKLPSGETWYRAAAGIFKTREEGLTAIRDLKRKGLSPFFPGYQKNRP
jgi:type II secretory pathway predicted ATPase ExeA